MDNCTFNNNNASVLGGAIADFSANGRIINSNFSNNNASISGGALYHEGINTNVNNCIFNDNLAINGGAIYGGAMNFTVANSTFNNNTATSNGGPIYNDLYMLVSGNIMSGNSAVLGKMIYNNGYMGILNLTFIDNSTWVVKNGSMVNLFATLLDDMGNTVTGQNISFYLNGVFFENVTAIEGYANIAYIVPLTSSDIPVSGVYAGNGNYSILIKNGLLQVRIPTNITISVLKKLKLEIQ